MDKRKKISFAGPSITQKEIDYVRDAVENGWYETFDMHTKKLESALADYVGRKYAVATHCGTVALHLATAGLGLKRGDEVVGNRIVPWKVFAPGLHPMHRTL